MRRRFAVLLAVVTSVTLAGPSHALADDDSGGGANNVVVVRNNTDGAVKTRAKTGVAETSGPTVKNGNVAIAHASCTDCRTAAVAVQVVVVEGPVTDFRPVNGAAAVNEECLRCQTFAFARQEVLTPGRPVDIGTSARDQISRLDAQIRGVAASDRPFDQMKVDLDSLTEQVVAVVQGEIQRAGTTAVREDHREVHEES